MHAIYRRYESAEGDSYTGTVEPEKVLEEIARELAAGSRVSEATNHYGESPEGFDSISLSIRVGTTGDRIVYGFTFDS